MKARTPTIRNHIAMFLKPSPPSVGETTLVPIQNVNELRIA